MSTESDCNELSGITFPNVFSYNIHGVSTYKFKQIGNYESVININTNDKGKFWSSCLFSLIYTFTIIIVLFLS